MKARANRLALLVPATIGFELAAVAWPFAIETKGWLAPALGLHAAAVALCVLAARRRNPTLTPAERDAVLLCALFVPLSGPLLAWFMPLSEREAPALDAHTALERRSYADGTSVGYAPRTTFTGDFRRDLSHRIDAQSYAEILRKGNVQERRAALRGLCSLGERRHIDLVRRAFSDSEDEIRLVAYAEIERLERDHETRLGKLEEHAEATPQQPSCWTALAVAHLDYARSGALDPVFARHHAARAVEFSQRARDLGDSGPNCARAGLLARLDIAPDSDEAADAARAWLEGFERTTLDTWEVGLARAELAWWTHDLDEARAIAGRLAREPRELPEWLAALTPQRNARRKAA